MKRYKEAEAIKSAFYKRLSKEKAEAGLERRSMSRPHARMLSRRSLLVTRPRRSRTTRSKAMETAFKGVYANYKKERAEYNRQQDAQREDNFAKKQAVMEGT